MTHFYPQGVGNFCYSYVLKYRVSFIFLGYVLRFGTVGGG